MEQGKIRRITRAVHQLESLGLGMVIEDEETRSVALGRRSITAKTGRHYPGNIQHLLFEIIVFGELLPAPGQMDGSR